MTALQIGLPLALHSDGEIAAFQEARERIPALLRGYGIEAEVSAFLFYTRALLKPERREKQVSNQAIARLPIIHMQTPVYMEDGLAFRKEDNAAHGTQSLLETCIEHTGVLKAMDPSGIHCTIDTHAGVFVYDSPESRPGVYSVTRFLDERDIIAQRVKKRFASLSKLSEFYDMPLLLENAIPAVMYPDRITAEPHLHYLPFNDVRTLQSISDKRTFDIAHWAAGRAAAEQFVENNVDVQEFFEILGVKDWDEYLASLGDWKMEAEKADAFHVSNTQGIGIGLDAHPDLAKKWGWSGTDEGLLPKDVLREYILYAQREEKPVMLEVDYDIKNIPVNKFAEADRFLSYVFSD